MYWDRSCQGLIGSCHTGLVKNLLVLRDELVTTACTVAALHAIRRSGEPGTSE